MSIPHRIRTLNRLFLVNGLSECCWVKWLRACSAGSAGWVIPAGAAQTTVGGSNVPNWHHKIFWGYLSGLCVSEYLGQHMPVDLHQTWEQSLEPNLIVAAKNTKATKPVKVEMVSTKKLMCGLCVLKPWSTQLLQTLAWPEISQGSW